MKCYFCHQRCHLLNKEDKDEDYHPSGLMWLCRNHPTKVLHFIRIRSFQVRGKGIQGKHREWVSTEIRWKDEKDEYCASFIMDGDKPFEVIRYRKPDEMTNIFDFGEDMIFKLSEHPKDITPENVVQKIKTYVLFK
jgi:hypothetical protein